jgi:hypothetical protein
MEGSSEKYEFSHQVYPPLLAGTIFNYLSHD